MKNFDYYMSLNYSVTVKKVFTEDEGWLWQAKIDDFDSCEVFASTVEEALEEVEKAKSAWIEISLAHGDLIPEPTLEEPSFSGRMTLRVPKTLHRAIVNHAKAEGVSLNQELNYLLGKALF